MSRNGSKILQGTAIAILGAILLGTGQGVEDLDNPLPGDAFLVQVSMTEIRIEGERCFGLAKITHVYYGSQSLLNRSFTAVSSDAITQGNAPVIIPRFKVNEQGIWIVTLRDDSVRYLPWDLYGISWPVRDLGQPEYDHALALAEMFERVETSDPRMRFELLRGYALGDEPLNAAAAIRMMAEQETAEVEIFLRLLLANNEISIMARVALDEVLSIREAEKWERSEGRVEFLRRLVSLEMSEAEASAGIGRLDILTQHGGIDESTLLELLRSFINSKRIPITQRRNALLTVGWAFDRFTDDSAAFEFILELVEKAEEEDIRIGAAYELLKHRPKGDSDRLERIETLRDSIQDPALRKILQKVVGE